MGIAGHSSLRGHAFDGDGARRWRQARPTWRPHLPRTGKFSMLQILTRSFTAAHPGQTGYRRTA
ncbi:hypothetical protein DPR02_37345 [Burkholderia cepacia]|uniref:Uncharacterized protein n=1 Tax=Burkholderia cepacia TaxID=292 RepID=A0AAQ0F4Y7_BURCE|nr:hypothetical protein DPR02_37345 [Burkholderia cepacia]